MKFKTFPVHSFAQIEAGDKIILAHSYIAVTDLEKELKTTPLFVSHVGMSDDKTLCLVIGIETLFISNPNQIFVVED